MNFSKKVCPHKGCKCDEPLLNSVDVVGSLDGPLQPGRPDLEPGVRQLLDVLAEHLGIRVPALSEVRVAADVAREIVMGFP